MRRRRVRNELATIGKSGRWLVVPVGFALVLGSVTGVAAASPSRGDSAAKALSTNKIPPLAPTLKSVPVKRLTPTVPGATTTKGDGKLGTGKAGTGKRFSPKLAAEIVGDRTATSSTFSNGDGTVSVERYAVPHFYQPPGKTTWLPIDSSLKPAAGSSNRWQSAANSFQASFGTPASPSGVEQITTGSSTLRFFPEGNANPIVTPVVSGSTATYNDLWPGVTVTDQVTATGVEENLVLSSAAATSDFSFRLTGAQAVAQKDGSLKLVDGTTPVGVIPAVTVSTADGASATTASGAQLVAVGDHIRVSLSKSWLASLSASAFPVTVDPGYGMWSFFEGTTNFGLTTSTSFSYTGPLATSTTTSTVSDGQVRLGTDSSGKSWASAVQINLPAAPTSKPTGLPWDLVLVQLEDGTNIPPCGACDDQHGTLCGCTIANENLYGLTAKPTTAAQIPAGLNLRDSGVAPTAGGLLTPWMQGKTSTWVGYTGGSSTSYTQLPVSDIYVIYTYHEPVPTGSVISPTNGSVLSTTVPLIQATRTEPLNQICEFLAPANYYTNGIGCDDQNYIRYDFKISTDAAGGQVVADSGWIAQPGDFNGPSGAFEFTSTNPQFQVPPGSLQDGGTYYVTVQNTDYPVNPLCYAVLCVPPPSPASTPVRFTVKARLGTGGPSPTDTIGAPPGQTSTPSQGTPSPAGTTASETVDMVTGNLAVSVPTHTMSTLSGPAGITLAYNSTQSSVATGSTYGLLGRYYADDGTHTFPSSPLGQRTDPEVSILGYPGQAPVGTLADQQAYLVRWTGFISAPVTDNGLTASWKIGGRSSGGLRIYLNGSTTPAYDDWSGSIGETDGLSTTAYPGGQNVPIEIDAWQAGPATRDIQLEVADTAQPQLSVTGVPSTWLSLAATAGLPAGWTMSSAALPTWNHASDLGDEVILASQSGLTETFTRNQGGTYTPPPGAADLLSAKNHILQLSTADGMLYTFNTDGTVASVTTVADDRHPAALQYCYAAATATLSTSSFCSITAQGTGPTVLREIEDPVSARIINLYYGNNANCWAPNTDQNPLLCQVNYWDGTNTALEYDPSSGELTAVVEPGNVATYFAYDSSNRVAAVRDSLASDYVATYNPSMPGCIDGDATTNCPVDTQFAYDTAGRVTTVTQPSPASGPRPQRTYTYGTGTTSMDIAGFSPSGQHDRTVTYDSQSRIVGNTNSLGLTAHTLWDTLDRPVVTADATGEQTSLVYDYLGNVTDSYGPAPTACFDPATFPAGVTASAPIAGYLPLANAATTTGCLTSVPHTHTGYDEGITGLGVTYWPNGQFSGAPTLHATGNGGVATGTCVLSTGSSGTGLCGSWASCTDQPGWLSG